MRIDKTFVEICLIEDLSLHIDNLISDENYAIEIDSSDLVLLVTNKIVEELRFEQEKVDSVESSPSSREIEM